MSQALSWVCRPRGNPQRGLWSGAAAAAVVALAVSSAAADTAPPNGAHAPDGLAANARLSVRQGGGSDAPGLLGKIKGPAASLDYDGGESGKFENIAGAMSGSGQNQGYVAGSAISQVFGGAELKLNYAGDEHGGIAVESRLSKKFDDMRLSWSSTRNRGFESDWTGSGATRAKQMNEGWLHWSPSATTYGVGFRETAHADGTHSTDLRTMQTRSLGTGTLMSSTTTRLEGGGPDKLTGNLVYYGPVGPFQFTGQIDYADYRPNKASLGLEATLQNRWSLYAYANQSLDSRAGGIDLGASREIAGFVASVYAGASEGQSAYAGVRLSVRLSAAPIQDRWVGLKSAGR